MAEREEKNALPTQGGREKETCTGWEQRDASRFWDKLWVFKENQEDSLKEMAAQGTRNLCYSLGPFQV